MPRETKLRRLFARPPGYPSFFSWLMTGMLRNPRGLIGALIASWFNLPVAVMLGGIGMVAGGATGYVGGSFTGSRTGGSWIHEVPILDSLFSSAFLQSGGILGLLAGAAIGAIGGFLIGLVLPWLAVFTASPAEGAGRFFAQLLVAFLCGFLFSTYSIAVENLRIRIVDGGRRPSRRERELIEPILQECARKMGLTSLPVLMMVDDRIPNASAYTRHIIVNVGFLDIFEYETEPLAGVLCHELTHWRNADCLSNYFINGVALQLYIAYNICTFLLRWTRGILRLLVWFVTWPILVSIRYFVMPLQMAGIQAAEYQGDQGAVYAGHREGIRKVLAKLRESFDGARNGWDMSILASHPPNELRLELVEEPGVQYPLPDADRPDVPTPVIIAGGLMRD
ncbi:M48 family metalloprotease [Kribbella sp. NPDC048928]|uniref:M48 family metalloprotease n=1 Tax=Kribbella sp. NPDC048928 TaxID=3364111 RepID=UPI00371FEC84